MTCCNDAVPARLARHLSGRVIHTIWRKAPTKAGPDVGVCQTHRGNSRDLAEEFGVVISTLRNAVSGRSWAHLKKGTPGGHSGGD